MTNAQLPSRDAAVIVARYSHGQVAVLSAPFPLHGGEYLFLPGGRQEGDESPEWCARRELREEAGITAETLRSLGACAIVPGSTARLHLFEACDLTLGPQELALDEEGFQLMWWSMEDALAAVSEGRFLLQGGPLALFLADRQLVTA
ncbi:NUDIX hydrolase [Kitasatospora indigofera]|uniref:NUDIX hydrolase n=1 Tax=Kitasatospora indigofera TaxID=67307 RepID=UPI003651FB10